MNDNDSSSYCDQNQNFREQCNIEHLSSHQMVLHYMEKFGNSQAYIYIFSGKTSNINNNLEEFLKKEFINMLQKHSSTYAWEYTDMKGINPKTCMHHIYIHENVKRVRQPQRRMNPNLREIIKEELQKLLSVNFIIRY